VTTNYMTTLEQLQDALSEARGTFAATHAAYIGAYTAEYANGPSYGRCACTAATATAAATICDAHLVDGTYEDFRVAMDDELELRIQVNKFRRAHEADLMTEMAASITQANR